MPRILEIACFNLPSALIAQEADANRIELCTDYFSGGITPSKELIQQARKQIHLPLHVIIRPRKGNFVYTTTELEMMKEDIRFCKEQLVDGLVLGCLTQDHHIDAAACEQLVELAYPLSLTFHRAIDQCHDIAKEINKLVELGFKRILSSGGQTHALAGKQKLKELQTEFGSSIILMPGGGIRSSNLKEIMLHSACTEYHSAAITGSDVLCDTNEILNLTTILKSV